MSIRNITKSYKIHAAIKQIKKHAKTSEKSHKIVRNLLRPQRGYGTLYKEYSWFSEDNTSEDNTSEDNTSEDNTSEAILCLGG